MKIVQSLYTGSFVNEDKLNFDSTVTLSGYNNSKLYWYTWIRSLFSFLEQGHTVELVTDDIGKELLVNRLGLPYSSVNTCLNEINPVSKYIWAIGKLKAYSIQEEPFLHFDNDAYFVKTIPQINKSIYVQEVVKRPTNLDDMHLNVCKDILLNFEDCPSQVRNFYNFFNTNNHSYTLVAGVLGGNDINLLKTYSKTVYDFMFTNRQKIDLFLQNKSPIYITYFMSFLEEQLLMQFYLEKYGSLDHIDGPLGIMDASSEDYNLIAEQRSEETGFVHFMTRIKLGQDLRAVEYRQRFISKTEQKYPEYCELVNIYLNN